MKKRDNITTMLDTAPYFNAVNLCLHGVITHFKYVDKAERRAILAELRKAQGKKAKGAGK